MSWGALMGLGKGMSDYSQTLGKHQEMLWEQRMADIRYNREKALYEAKIQSEENMNRARIQADKDLVALNAQAETEKLEETARIAREERIKQGEQILKQAGVSSPSELTGADKQAYFKVRFDTTISEDKLNVLDDEDMKVILDMTKFQVEQYTQRTGKAPTAEVVAQISQGVIQDYWRYSGRSGSFMGGGGDGFSKELTEENLKEIAEWMNSGDIEKMRKATKMFDAASPSQRAQIKEIYLGLSSEDTEDDKDKGGGKNTGAVEETEENWWDIFINKDAGKARGNRGGAAKTEGIEWDFFNNFSNSRVAGNNRKARREAPVKGEPPRSALEQVLAPPKEESPEITSPVEEFVKDPGPEKGDEPTWKKALRKLLKYFEENPAIEGKTFRNKPFSDHRPRFSN